MLKSCGFRASSLSTYDFSILYTTLPHNLIKDKLVDFSKEKVLFILPVMIGMLFCTSDAIRNYNLWSCQNVCDTFFADLSLWDDSNASLPDTIPVPQAVIEPITFTTTEGESVLNSLKTVKTEKAAGPDAINNRLLSELAQPLASPLCDLFNFSLLSGKVPDIWKPANIFTKRMIQLKFHIIDPYPFQALQEKSLKN